MNDETSLKWYEWSDKDEEIEKDFLRMLYYIGWGILFGEFLKFIGLM